MKIRPKGPFRCQWISEIELKMSYERENHVNICFPSWVNSFVRCVAHVKTKDVKMCCTYFSYTTPILTD